MHEQQTTEMFSRLHSLTRRRSINESWQVVGQMVRYRSEDLVDKTTRRERRTTAPTMIIRDWSGFDQEVAKYETGGAEDVPDASDVQVKVCVNLSRPVTYWTLVLVVVCSNSANGGWLDFWNSGLLPCSETAF